MKKFDKIVKPDKINDSLNHTSIILSWPNGNLNKKRFAYILKENRSQKLLRKCHSKLTQNRKRN